MSADPGKGWTPGECPLCGVGLFEHKSPQEISEHATSFLADPELHSKDVISYYLGMLIASLQFLIEGDHIAAQEGLMRAIGQSTTVLARIEAMDRSSGR